MTLLNAFTLTTYEADNRVSPTVHRRRKLIVYKESGYLEITDNYIEYSDWRASLLLAESRDDPKLSEGYFLRPPFKGYSYILALKCTYAGQDITHLINHYK